MSASQRRGFALIAVLWVVVTLAGLTLVAASRAEVGAVSAASRVGFVRGRWAAEACLAEAQAALDERAERGHALLPLAFDTLRLADGSACALEVTDSSMNATVQRVFVSSRASLPGQSTAARIDELFVGAGTRAAPVRREVW